MSIKIKCPNCGKKLEINIKEGANPKLDSVKIKCPMCKIISPYPMYKKIDETKCYDNDCTKPVGKNSDDTDYQNKDNDPTLRASDKTDVNPMYSAVIGELQVDANVNNFKLREGRNVIGRKATTSKADIQIMPKTEKSRISREHIVINVKKLKSGNYIHALSLYKDEVNDTFYNDQKLKFGDSYFLKKNDVIKMPDGLIINFVLSDKEKTLC